MSIRKPCGNGFYAENMITLCAKTHYPYGKILSV